MRKPLPRTYLQSLSRHERRQLFEGASVSVDQQEDASLHGSVEVSALRAEIERLEGELANGRAREQALQAQVVSAQRLLGVQLHAGRNAADTKRELKDAAAAQQARNEALQQAVSAARAECDVLKGAFRDLEANRDKLQDDLVMEKSRYAELHERYLQIAQGMMTPQQAAAAAAGAAGGGGGNGGVGSTGNGIKETIPQNLASVLAQLSLITKQRDSLATRCKDLTNRLEQTTCKSKVQGVRKAVVQGQQQQRTQALVQQKTTAMAKRLEAKEEELQQKTAYITRLEKAMLAQHTAMKQMASKQLGVSFKHAVRPTPRTTDSSIPDLGQPLTTNLGQPHTDVDRSSDQARIVDVAWMRDQGPLMPGVRLIAHTQPGDEQQAKHKNHPVPSSVFIAPLTASPTITRSNARDVAPDSVRIESVAAQHGPTTASTSGGPVVVSALQHDLHDIGVVEDELASLQLQLHQLATSVHQRSPSPDNALPPTAGPTHATHSTTTIHSCTASPSPPRAHRSARTASSASPPRHTGWTSPTHLPHPHRLPTARAHPSEHHHQSPSKGVATVQTAPVNIAMLLSYPSRPDEPTDDHADVHDALDHDFDDGSGNEGGRGGGRVDARPESSGTNHIAHVAPTPAPAPASARGVGHDEPTTTDINGGNAGVGGTPPTARALSTARLKALAARRRAAAQQHLRRQQQQRQPQTRVTPPQLQRQRQHSWRPVSSLTTSPMVLDRMNSQEAHPGSRSGPLCGEEDDDSDGGGGDGGGDGDVHTRSGLQGLQHLLGAVGSVHASGVQASGLVVPQDHVRQIGHRNVGVRVRPVPVPSPVTRMLAQHSLRTGTTQRVHGHTYHTEHTPASIQSVDARRSLLSQTAESPSYHAPPDLTTNWAPAARSAAPSNAPTDARDHAQQHRAPGVMEVEGQHLRDVPTHLAHGPHHILGSPGFRPHQHPPASYDTATPFDGEHTTGVHHATSRQGTTSSTHQQHRLPPHLTVPNRHVAPIPQEIPHPEVPHLRSSVTALPLSVTSHLTGVQRAIQLLAEASQGSVSSDGVREWQALGELLKSPTLRDRQGRGRSAPSRTSWSPGVGAAGTHTRTVGVPLGRESVGAEGRGGEGWQRSARGSLEMQTGRGPETPVDARLEDTAESAGWASSPALPHMQQWVPVTAGAGMMPGPDDSVGGDPRSQGGDMQPVSPEPMPVPLPAWMPRPAHLEPIGGETSGASGDVLLRSSRGAQAVTGSVDRSVVEETCTALRQLLETLQPIADTLQSG